MQSLKTFVGRAIFWAGWPLWWMILRNTRRSRVLLIANDCVLLTKGTLSAGEWSLPGGGIHTKEDFRTGACRELYEELSIVIPADQLQELAVETMRNSGIDYHAHFFVAELKDRTEPKLSLEIAEARWVPLAEIQNLRRDAVVDRALELLATW